MSKSIVTKWTLVGGVALALVLAGCGNRMPANVPVDEEEPGTEAPANPTTPASPDVPAPTPAPTAPTTPAYVAPVVGSLTISGLEKTKSGLIFFKHMTVKGSVVNTSSVPLSGTIKVEFKDSKGILTKTMVTEETKTQVVAQLQPGQSFPFEIKSDETGIDDAEVTVETMQPAASAGTAAASAAYASGGAYGAASYPTAGAYPTGY